LLGYPDQARKRCQEALTAAQEMSHPFSQAFALHVVTLVHHLCRDVQAAKERAEALIVLSRKHGFVLREAAGILYQSWVLAEQGQEKDGIEGICQGMAAWEATGAEFGRCHHLAILAETYGKVGRAEEGLALLVKALAMVDKAGDRWYEAELYRLKGQLTLQSKVLSPKSQVEETLPGRVGIAHQNVSLAEAGTVGGAHPTVEAEAEHCFLKAIEVARRQQAKSLELRATMSLARLWQQQGRQKDAHQMLAEIYGWFTEGFDTADLKEAKALLNELEQ